MDTITSGSNKSLVGKVFAIIAIVLFIIITVYWLLVHPFDPNNFVDQKNVWSSTYELISIVGGVFGVIASIRWGGYKSVLGRAILAFAIGLFLQSFGQTVYNYYTLVDHIQAPYPSLGDVGYFGSVIVYIYGAFVLLKGMKFPIKAIHNRILAILLPLAMLLFSYFIFLKDYQYTGSALTTFLDFGYPLGQAIYVSVALLVVFMSRDYLGGIMRKPILLLLVALFVQYICDFDFLYQANHNTWYAGGPGDYLYAVSYFLMTIVLINIGQVKVKWEQKSI